MIEKSMDVTIPPLPYLMKLEGKLRVWHNFENTSMAYKSYKDITHDRDEKLLSIFESIY